MNRKKQKIARIIKKIEKWGDSFLNFLQTSISIIKWIIFSFFWLFGSFLPLIIIIFAIALFLISASFLIVLLFQTQLMPLVWLPKSNIIYPDTHQLASQTINPKNIKTLEQFRDFLFTDWLSTNLIPTYSKFCSLNENILAKNKKLLSKDEEYQLNTLLNTPIPLSLLPKQNIKLLLDKAKNNSTTQGEYEILSFLQDNTIAHTFAESVIFENSNLIEKIGDKYFFIGIKNQNNNENQLFKQTIKPKDNNLNEIKRFVDNWCWTNKSMMMSVWLLQTQLFLLNENWYNKLFLDAIDYTKTSFLSKNLNNNFNKENEIPEENKIDKWWDKSLFQYYLTETIQTKENKWKISKNIFDNWLFINTNPNNKIFDNNFYKEILNTLTKVNILKWFISWKYYLTKTSPLENEYVVDPIYWYMSIRNPFSYEASITTIQSYDSINEFFLSFNNTIYWEPWEEQWNQNALQQIDITQEAIKIGYRWSKQIFVNFYTEKDIPKFIEKLSYAFHRINPKKFIEKYWDKYSEETYSIKFCLRNPISITHKFAFETQSTLSNKTYTSSYKVQELHNLCYFVHWVHLDKEVIKNKKYNELLISWKDNQIGIAERVKTSIQVLPYYPKDNNFNDSVIDLWIASSFQQLKYQQWQLAIEENKEHWTFSNLCFLENNIVSLKNYISIPIWKEKKWNFDSLLAQRKTKNWYSLSKKNRPFVKYFKTNQTCKSIIIPTTKQLIQNQNSIENPIDKESDKNEKINFEKNYHILTHWKKPFYFAKDLANPIAQIFDIQAHQPFIQDAYDAQEINWKTLDEIYNYHKIKNKSLNDMLKKLLFKYKTSYKDYENFKKTFFTINGIENLSEIQNNNFLIKEFLKENKIIYDEIKLNQEIDNIKTSLQELEVEKVQWEENAFDYFIQNELKKWQHYDTLLVYDFLQYYNNLDKEKEALKNNWTKKYNDIFKALQFEKDYKELEEDINQIALQKTQELFKDKYIIPKIRAKSYLKELNILLKDKIILLLSILPEEQIQKEYIKEIQETNISKNNIENNENLTPSSQSQEENTLLNHELQNYFKEAIISNNSLFEYNGNYYAKIMNETYKYQNDACKLEEKVKEIIKKWDNEEQINLLNKELYNFSKLSEESLKSSKETLEYFSALSTSYHWLFKDNYLLLFDKIIELQQKRQPLTTETQNNNEEEQEQNTIWFSQEEWKKIFEDNLNLWSKQCLQSSEYQKNHLQQIQKTNQEKNLIHTINSSINSLLETANTYTALNPYILYSPKIEEDFEDYHHIVINPLLSIFKQIPKSNNLDMKRKEMVQLEKLFNSFLLYVNIWDFENSPLFQPYPSQNLLIWYFWSAFKYIKKEIKKIKIYNQITFDSYYFPQPKLNVSLSERKEEYLSHLLPYYHKYLQEYKNQWSQNIKEKSLNNEEIWEHLAQIDKQDDSIKVSIDNYIEKNWKIDYFTSKELGVSKEWKYIREKINEALTSFIIETNISQFFIKWMEQPSVSLSYFHQLQKIKQAYLLSNKKIELFLWFLDIQTENAKQWASELYKDMLALDVQSETINNSQYGKYLYWNLNPLDTIIAKYWRKTLQAQAYLKQHLNEYQKEIIANDNSSEEKKLITNLLDEEDIENNSKKTNIEIENTDKIRNKIEDYLHTLFLNTLEVEKQKELEIFFSLYNFDKQQLLQKEIIWWNNLIVIEQLLNPYYSIEEHLNKYEDTIIQEQLNRDLSIIAPYDEIYNRVFNNIKSYFDMIIKVKPYLSLSKLKNNKHITEVTESMIEESYNLWELFKVDDFTLLQLIIKPQERKTKKAEHLLQLDSENYLSIIAYNFFSYQSEKDHFKEIKSILDWMKKITSWLKDEQIKKLEWSWFVEGLQYIECKEDSKCQTLLSNIQKLKNWSDFNSYIEDLSFQLEIDYKNLNPNDEESLIRKKELEDTIHILKALLDKFLYFSEKVQIKDVWDIVWFWNEENKICEAKWWSPEAIRWCKLLNVRKWRFNLSWALSWYANGLTGQCVRWANILNKYFNNELESCRYSLDWWNQWATYWWLLHWNYQWILVWRWWQNRNAASCWLETIRYAWKTFWNNGNTLPRFCPVIASKEHLQNWKIKHNMIGVVWWAWWGQYGHVVYIWWVDIEKNLVGVAEMNYKHNLALGSWIDSLTVRQSLVPVEKFKIYFDLDKPFSLEEIKNHFWLDSVDKVNNDMIERFCENYNYY